MLRVILLVAGLPVREDNYKPQGRRLIHDHKGRLCLLNLNPLLILLVPTKFLKLKVGENDSI